MKSKEYKKIVKKTAVFPQEVDNFGLAYAMLGFVDELFEADEAFEKWKYDHGNREDYFKEVGDVLWYAAAICEESGANFDTVVKIVTNERALKYCEMSEIFGMVKKYYRDEKKLDLNKIENALGGTLEDIKLLENNIEEIMQMNFDKLTKRKEKGTLKGDGDER